jgi:hypothetical protein
MGAHVPLQKLHPGYRCEKKNPDPKRLIVNPQNMQTLMTLASDHAFGSPL